MIKSCGCDVAMKENEKEKVEGMKLKMLLAVRRRQEGRRAQNEMLSLRSGPEIRCQQ